MEKSGTTHKFTGKERDSESNLDNFGARYNSSQQGRFMSPDPSNLSVDFWIPPTWNRYSYALNNPLEVEFELKGGWPRHSHLIFLIR
ncbi:MAG: RHS repeat domain-containing protein [Candidatus Acidiferrales bacterium]